MVLMREEKDLSSEGLDGLKRGGEMQKEDIRWVSFTLARWEMRVEEIRWRSKCSSCDPGKF